MTRKFLRKSFTLAFLIWTTLCPPAFSESYTDSTWAEEFDESIVLNSATPLLNNAAPSPEIGTPTVMAPLSALLNALELAAFGKMQNKKLGMIKRLENLESSMLSADAAPKSGVDLTQRIGELFTIIGPSQKQVEQGIEAAEGNNWFLNPPECEWLNALGRGIKNTGVAARTTLAETGNVLTSREFIQLVGTAALVVGAVYAAKGIAANSRPYYGYRNSDERWVNPYFRSDGHLVNGYWQKIPNNTMLDNFSTRGNYNYHTGQPGWILPTN